MKKAILSILGILIIGIAGCTMSSGDSPGSNADVDGTVSIEDGWFVGEGNDGSEGIDDSDEDVELVEDDIEDEADDTADADAEEDDDEESDDEEDSTCEFPMHGIEFSEDDVQIEAGDEKEITITVTGGSGNFFWYPVESALPLGMDFDEGLTESHIFGSPTETGLFEVNVKVKDVICDRSVIRTIFIDVYEIPSVGILDLDGDEDAVDSRKQFRSGAVEPFVMFWIDKDFTNGDTSSVLKTDVVNELESFRGFVPVTVGAYSSVNANVEAEEGRYTIEMKRLTPDPFVPTPQVIKLTNHEMFPSFVTSLRITTVHFKMLVTDTWHDDAHFVYRVSLKTTCRLAKLRDMKFRFKGTYHGRHDGWYDKGYCNKDGSKTRATEAGFGLTTSSKGFKKGNEDFRGGVFNKEYELTRQGKNKTHENVIKDPVKVIYWDRDNIKHEASCLEDITKAGIYLNEDHCYGNPSLHVKAIEVKACRNRDYLDVEWSEDCFFAYYDDLDVKKKLGHKNMHNGGFEVDVEKLHKDEDGNVWREERDAAVKSYFKSFNNPKYYY